MVVLHTMKLPIYVRPLSDAERKTMEAGLRSPDAFTLKALPDLARKCRWPQRLPDRSQPRL